jgi:hypothetical protein
VHNAIQLHTGAFITPVFFTTFLYHTVGWSSRGGAVADKGWCSAPRVVCLAASPYNGCSQTIGSTCS